MSISFHILLFQNTLDNPVLVKFMQVSNALLFTAPFTACAIDNLKTVNTLTYRYSHSFTTVF